MFAGHINQFVIGSETRVICCIVLYESDKVDATRKPMKENLRFHGEEGNERPELR